MLRPLRLPLCVIAFVLVLAAAPAHAQTPEVDTLRCTSQAGNFADVIEGCTRLLRIAQGRDRIIVLSHRAGAYVDKSDWDNAIADLTELIRLHPDGMFYELRGTQWQAKAEHAKAAADFEEAEGRGIMTAEHYMRAAFSYHRLSQDANELRALNFALLMDPQLVPALYARGQIWQSMGNDRDAVTDFEAALKLSPDTPVIRAALESSRGRLRGEDSPPVAEPAK